MYQAPLTSVCERSPMSDSYNRVVYMDFTLRVVHRVFLKLSYVRNHLLIYSRNSLLDSDQPIKLNQNHREKHTQKVNIFS